MAKLYNLCRVRTSTTGTGSLVMGVAVTGFLTAAAAGVSNADVIAYSIRDGASSEIGYGTVSVSGSTYTLTRTVRKSTNSDSAISLSGNAIVAITPSAEDLQSDVALSDGTAALPALAFQSDDDTGLYRIGANEVGFSVGGAGTGFGLSATAFYPITNDAWSLGKSGNAVADYYGATGHVFNLGAGNYTITHSSGDLAFSGIVTVPNTGLHILDTNASHDLIIVAGSDLTTDRQLSIVTGDAARSVTLTGDLAMSGAFNLTHTVTGNTNVTYPTTGTLATLAGSEALSNKTIGNTNTVTLKDTLFTVQDDGDATKLFALELSGITTANTRTWTVPDFSDTLVGLTGTQTLTNKTLTAAKIASGGFIADANGNELIIFTTTAAAVNEWTFANGSTGVNPKLTASGETNVGLDFLVKGTGVYNFLATASGPTDVRWYEDADNGSNYVSIIAPASLGSNQVLTLPDATDTFAGIAATQTLSNKTLTAPKIASGGFLADANGNELVIFTTTAAAVNETTYANAATGSNPSLAATGGDTNISISLAGKGTGGIILGGTSTNDSAAAGKIGEYIESIILAGSAVSLTTTATANVTSISRQRQRRDRYGHGPHT